MSSVLEKKLEVSVGEKSFYINGKPVFIYSGEIHYFRIPKKYWNEHLKSAKAAGLNTVSSYIPWNWHEYEEGKFDFTGKSHPQRDLVKFIELVEENGLYFSARVGPVSNAELVEEGIPKWLLKNNPDIYVQRKGFNNLPHALLLSYLNPKFHSFVKKWYDQVMPIVAKKQIQEGGPIILVQLCNEISMIHWLHKAYDENSYVSQKYQDFLKEKYGSISSLNTAYGAHYNDFHEVQQPKGEVNPQNLNIFFDWALFYRRYYALYFRFLADCASEHSITVPISANVPQFYDYDVRGRGVFSPMTTSIFRDFSVLTPKTVYGGAYQMRRLDYENFHDVVITSEVTKLLDKEAPTICAELQTGIMRDRPRLYPADVELNIKTSVAHGLNGINCYMFSSGENISGFGAFGAYHDWQAPVGLDGKEKKDHFEPLKEWGQFIKKFGSELGGTKKVAETSIGFYVPYYATEYYTGPWASQLESFRTYFFYDGIARLVQLAGFNYNFCDLMRADKNELNSQESLCVFSLEFMDAETQTKLKNYVEDGGKLIIGPKIPSFDLSGKKCSILAEALGLELGEKKEKEMILWKGKECFFEFPIQTFNGHKNKPLMKTVSGDACVTYGRTGKGSWISYGFPLQHIFDYLVPMVKEWYSKLGVQPVLETQPWDLQATLRWNGENGFLFIFNYHDVDKEGVVEIRRDPTDLVKGKKQKWFSKRVSLGRRSGLVIPLKLQKKKIVEVKK